jgi:hypothetical protein
MPPPRFLAALLLAASLGAAARGDDAADAVPFVGRPAGLPFSDASGDFRVRAAAAPTRLQAQDPLTLTLTVTAFGDEPVRRPPRRMDLRELPDVADRFDVDDPEDGGDRRPDPRTWEFVYRLHPKAAGAAAVPSLPFVFYNPEIQYPGKGFQTAYTDPIPLEVRPRDVYQAPLNAPDFLFDAAPADRVLARQEPWAPPGPLTVAALLLAPPLACAAWYACWRRLYPDAARRARRRRSHAARRALHALRGAGRLPPAERAARAAAAVAGYLRERLDAPVEEPTPAEAAACLARAGVSPALSEQAADFLRACDAVRFGPAGGADAAGLPADAERLILSVDEATESPAEAAPPPA